MRAPSEQSTRTGLIFDGNLDTRWMTGTRQAGTEWVEIRLARPSDVRRLGIVGAGRTLLDYPRHLKVDSVDSGGATRTLFDDSVVNRYVESVASTTSIRQSPSIWRRTTRAFCGSRKPDTAAAGGRFTN